ncbi:globin domain-containing protein [Massilia sp. W12]|uniref:globin domain-containing protein n=1 Tax=Massilia sp. W12 TaxID=3126507 RepID=UPI0030D11B11
MLSSQSRPLIAASVPVLREHGAAISQCFYRNMLTEHSELKHLFNLGNQANGSQQQALAAAVFAYAANIDNRQALAPVLERIAHKHAAVGIKASHYSIVGRHLLGAIQEVLGAAASPALLAAWDEAYWLLAAELTSAEAALYRASGAGPGEWQSVRVCKLERESEDVLSFYLQSADGASPGPFAPGQYISVLTQPGEWRQMRQYSLSDAPQCNYWRISVKREPAQAAQPAGLVSNWLHEHVQAGSVLQVSRAYGEFQPLAQRTRPMVLLSAGIGVTPMMAVLNSLRRQDPQRALLFLHAARDGAHHALQADLSRALEAMPHLRSLVAYETPREQDVAGMHYQHSGQLELRKILRPADLEADFWLCGPLGFMRAQWRSLIELGVAPQRIRREVFGPEMLEQLL